MTFTYGMNQKVESDKDDYEFALLREYLTPGRKVRAIVNLVMNNYYANYILIEGDECDIHMHSGSPGAQQGAAHRSDQLTEKGNVRDRAPFSIGEYPL